MKAKRDFLARFLVRKQLELSEILASRRTINYTKREAGGSTNFVKFKEKTFQLTECNEEDEIVR